MTLFGDILDISNLHNTEIFEMGCTSSKDLSGETNSCWKQDCVTKTITSTNCNEVEIDMSHFSTATKTLGLGGFGVVRCTTKLTGVDQGVDYALKTMGKNAILKRSSGPT